VRDQSSSILGLLLRRSSPPRSRSEFFLVTIEAVGSDVTVYPACAEFLAFGEDGALDDFDADMVAAAAGAYDSDDEHAAVAPQDSAR
jgi:hypothetical protein